MAVPEHPARNEYFEDFSDDLLAKTRALRETHRYAGRVEMDGGINADTVAACAAAGADVLVAGTAVYGAPDMGAAIRDLRSRAEAAR